MTSLISWIPPATITALGWALLHFIWQGAAIAALAAGLMQCCRGPSTCYVIGVAALVLMLAVPLVTFLFLVDGGTGIPGFAGFALPAIVNAVGPPVSAAELLTWLVEAWACGVALLGSRFAANLLLLEWHGQGDEPAPHLLALCRDVQQRLGIDRAIRYLECNWLSAPAGFGALCPVILLPVRALTGLSEEQLRAVIAHELAHIRRWDFAVNLFQVAVGALLFYHPAIWWLNRRIRAEREICCDEIAVSACGNPLAYARALTLLAERKHAPAMAMAINRGLLTGRIQRLLRGEIFDARSFVTGMAGSLLLLFVSLAGGNLLMTAFPAAPAQNIALVVAQAIPGPAAIAPIRQPQREARLDKAIVRHLSRLPIPRASLPPVTLTPEYPVAASAPQGLTASPIVAVADVHPVQVADVPQGSAQADDEYPAPIVAINASQSTYDWERQDASNYCDQYAQQTVEQGANRPFHVDDAARQRYAFFFWHCMATNGQLTGGPGNPQSPVYQPVGTASAENPVNISGSWAISFPPFAASRSCSFTQSGNSISGTCARSEGGGAAHGVVDGRQVRWTWTYLDDEKRPVELDFIGMVGPDGTMTGASIQTPPWMGRQIQSFTARLGPAVAEVASQ